MRHDTHPSRDPSSLGISRAFDVVWHPTLLLWKKNNYCIFMYSQLYSLVELLLELYKFNFCTIADLAVSNVSLFPSVF